MKLRSKKGTMQKTVGCCAIRFAAAEHMVATEGIGQMTRKESVRNSNLELLRIISLVLIIANHYLIHGAINPSELPFSIQKVVTLFLAGGGKLGVCIFVLISGYFSAKSDFNLKRTVATIIKVWAFSVVLFFIFHFLITPDYHLTAKTLLKIFFPNTFAQWWFVTTYLALTLISPFLNKAIHALNQKQHRNLIILFVVIWCIIPTFTTASFEISALAWFVTLYITAAYFSVYQPKIKMKSHVVLCVFWTFVIFASIFLFEYIGERYSIPVLKNNSIMMTHYNRLPTFMLSMELFLVFAYMKARHSKFINITASTTFGIYLLHENIFSREYLWKNIFNNAEYYGSYLFFLQYLGAVILVFTICSLIDLIFWQKTIGKLLNTFLDKRLGSCMVFTGKIQMRILKLIRKLV